MFLYIVLCVIAGILLYAFLGLLTKKADELVYNSLDKAGKTINVVLTAVYVLISPLYLFLGLISYPACEGFLGVIGWIVSILNSSTAMFCGLGLGLSVYFRKKGKSKLSFAIQFLGAVAIIFTVISYCVFVGNLLQPLN
jgi:fumarate reductase subunit D